MQVDTTALRSDMIALRGQVADLAAGQTELRRTVADLATGQTELQATVADLAAGQAVLTAGQDELRGAAAAMATRLGRVEELLTQLVEQGRGDHSGGAGS